MNVQVYNPAARGLAGDANVEKQQPLDDAAVWADPRANGILAVFNRHRRVFGLPPLSGEVATEAVRQRIEQLDADMRWLERVSRRDRAAQPRLR